MAAGALTVVEREEGPAGFLGGDEELVDLYEVGGEKGRGLGLELYMPGLTSQSAQVVDETHKTRRGVGVKRDEMAHLLSRA